MRSPRTQILIECSQERADQLEELSQHYETDRNSMVCVILREKLDEAALRRVQNVQILIGNSAGRDLQVNC